LVAPASTAVPEQADILTRDMVAIEDTWDLSRIYPDDASWEADAARVPELLATAAAHRGMLDASPMALLVALDDLMEVRRVVERLRTFAALRRDEDQTAAEAFARYDRSISLAVQVGEALAWVMPEILAMPEGKLGVFATDAVLHRYRHLLDDVQRQRPYVRSTEVEEVLAQAADLTRAPIEAFSALDNADLTYGKVRDDEGNEITLTKGRHGALMESRNREVRREAHETMTAAYTAHKHTLASLYASSVRNDIFQARVRGHRSARSAALFDDNLPESVYDSLIASVREASPTMERFLDLRRKALGLEQLALYDLRVALAPEPARKYTYEEAIDIVLGGLTPLGSRYLDDLREGFNSRWVDVYETKGKRSGAYSWGTYGANPVILMNWNGTLNDVFTLAHEAGHAMHTYYASKTQPYHDYHYTTFLAEIASTLNEVLLTWHLLSELPQDDLLGRFSILNRFADDVYGTLIVQTMFAEFEHLSHQIAESGEPITLERLNQIYGDLQGVYTPGLEIDETIRGRWARIPHFYRAFYVFQYATGLSAAIALAGKIRDEGQPAAERYLEMLAAGGSDYSLPLLQRAGVDLTTPEPVRLALVEFDRTVKEMEQLAEQGILAGARGDA
jgi:oligoendopeptidase F